MEAGTKKWHRNCPKVVPQNLCTTLVRYHATPSLKMAVAVFYVVDVDSTEHSKYAVERHPSNYATINC